MRSLSLRFSSGLLFVAIVAVADGRPLRPLEVQDESLKLKAQVFYRSDRDTVPANTREAIEQQLKLIQDDYVDFKGEVVFELKEVQKPEEGVEPPHAEIKDESSDRMVIEFPYSNVESKTGQFADFYVVDPKVERVKATIKQFEKTRHLITSTVPETVCPSATVREKRTAKPKPHARVREVTLPDNGPGCVGGKKINQTTRQATDGDYFSSLPRYYGVKTPPTKQEMAEIHALWSLWGNHRNNGRSSYFKAACTQGTFSRLVSVVILDPKTGKRDAKLAESTPDWREGKNAGMGMAEEITIECCVK